MSKKRSCGCGNAPIVAAVSPVGSLCTNPICAIILLIILQRTCLLENKNAFLLILLFLGFCFCSRRPALAGVGCGGY
ncbi:MAG TPA: hypothetical protein VIM70_20960 [Clostridium sp.]|uniref:hypothetical protein n=1 Tax=Clostridium sp. TaxID=1506 RepID=UPI002F94D35D